MTPIPSWIIELAHQSGGYASLPDGVYLSLPEDIYFLQDRLGSSDLIDLHRYKEGWWWSSKHNPDRPADTKTKAQNYGSALHAIMLEGVAAYEERFAVEPDRADYPQLLESIPQIKAALVDAGMSLRNTSSYRLDDWIDAAAIHCAGKPVWAAIMRDHEDSLLRSDGTVRRSVSAIEDRMLRYMLEAALEDEECRRLLGYGQDVPLLAEVSIFWTDEYGLKRRARLDKPVPHFTMDLKSLGNWQGRDLVHSIGDRIRAEGYDIQVGDYHVARRHMHRMVRQDAGRFLFGGTLEERAWVEAIAIRDMRFDWIWLFYQKPEPSGRAPIIFPVREHWRGPFHTSGHRKAWRAARFYREQVERVGLERPWSRVMPVHYTVEAATLEGRQERPHITVGNWDWDNEPVPGEEEAFA